MEKNQLDKEQDLRYYLDDINYQLKHSYRQKNKLRLTFRVYTFFGLIISIIGIIYFISSFFEFQLSVSQRFALVMSGAGLLLSLLAKFYVEFTKEREKEYEKRNRELENISTFILNWATLERATSHFFRFNKIENNKFAIGRNLAILTEKKVVTMREFLTLEKALDVRNRIVHDKITSGSEDLEKLSDEVMRITDKIIDHSEKNTMHNTV
jgi:hypothetical protein